MPVRYFKVSSGFCDSAHKLPCIALVTFTQWSGFKLDLLDIAWPEWKLFDVGPEGGAGPRPWEPSSLALPPGGAGGGTALPEAPLRPPWEGGGGTGGDGIELPMGLGDCFDE